MELRPMSTAFLFHDNHVLMMKKQGSRLAPFEFWSGLGGHLEADELHHPKRACLREIAEESGIEEQDIRHLTLKYMLLRVKEGEIRQQFVYFGQVGSTEVVASDEGELHWVHRDDLLQLRLSRVIHEMLRHYLNHPATDEVMIGTMTIARDEQPAIQWSELKDPIVF